ncbi:MAG: serine hydrolase domain-containing protein [Gemmatimonadales bacterium]|nr:serine hydrolase domain-containing protein [Gemmatimonadales bacterium]
MRHTMMLAAVAVGTLAGCGGAGAAPETGGGRPSGERGALVARIDSLISAPITAGKVAGASIAVVKGRDTIAVQGFGLANIELNVPTMARASYEIGSVSKQFTGVAIMQLVEQGKINLDDDITKYLPDYNTQGRRIKVRQLLDHTSGIKGYTEMEAFRTLQVFDYPRDTLVKLFSKQPFDFEPGEEEIYNNSAFFLAGLIIAKVSGMSYEDYVQKNLFDKAGMKDAHYCSERKIHKLKVTGYDSDSAGLIQKRPLSHQWPYAAGSLCASAVDLVAWNEALHRDGKLLGAAAYQEFVSPGVLNDGTVLGYAKGIAVYPRLGRKAYHHGGGINGFLSENIYFPDDSLSVIVLFNTAGSEGPDKYALQIAEMILGKPADAAKPIDGDANRFAGVYAGRGRGRPTEITVAVADGKVTAKLPFADSAQALTYLGNDTFGRDEMRLVFSGVDGKIAKLRIDAGYGNNVLLKK